MAGRRRKLQRRALQDYESRRSAPEEAPVSKPRIPTPPNPHPHGSGPRALNEVEYMALRLQEAAIRQGGVETMTMEVAVRCVDTALHLLSAASRHR